MNTPPAELRWFEADSGRLERERRTLGPPWVLEEDDDGRVAWRGGHLGTSCAGASSDPREAELIYPRGFPARFIEVRLDPELPTEHWGAAFTHVNADGSACYITAEAWRPYDDAATALRLARSWWWNYFWLSPAHEWLRWPGDGTRIAVG